ncbi:hypothetical protein LTR10_016021 [Elasticomyces elasticus]|nr:hypothetical protein LTR10_016021 [Elasticomyces elasticus]
MTAPDIRSSSINIEKSNEKENLGPDTDLLVLPMSGRASLDAWRHSSGHSKSWAQCRFLKRVSKHKANHADAQKRLRGRWEVTVTGIPSAFLRKQGAKQFAAWPRYCKNLHFSYARPMEFDTLDCDISRDVHDRESIDHIPRITEDQCAFVRLASLPLVSAAPEDRTLREWIGYKTFSGMVLGSKYRLKGLVESLRDNHEIYRAESLLYPSASCEAHLFEIDVGILELRHSRLRNLRRLRTRPSVMDIFRYRKRIWVVVHVDHHSGSQARADTRRELRTSDR